MIETDFIPYSERVAFARDFTFSSQPYPGKEPRQLNWLGRTIDRICSFNEGLYFLALTLSSAALFLFSIKKYFLLFPIMGLYFGAQLKELKQLKHESDLISGRLNVIRCLGLSKEQFDQIPIGVNLSDSSIIKGVSEGEPYIFVRNKEGTENYLFYESPIYGHWVVYRNDLLRLHFRYVDNEKETDWENIGMIKAFSSEIAPLIKPIFNN